ncbi:MAG: hypothetical protein ACXADB_07205 [Candidatus Hermodarchaeia archaeon]|jgi:hypothetical protein
MADEKKHDERVEPIVAEDGRRAERKTLKTFDPDSREGVEVVETSIEPKVDLRLARRETIKTRPVVHRREVELIDEETGEVLETEVESIDPEIRMEVRERIVSAAALPKEEESEFVTRAELRQDLLDVVDHLKEDRGYSHVSAQSMVEQRLGEKSSLSSWVNVGLMALAGALAAGIIWVLVAA